VRVPRARAASLFALLFLSVADPAVSGLCGQAEIPEHNLLDVPYHAQEKPHYCGPASIQMALEFLSGSLVSQDTLAGEMGTDPVIGITYVAMMSVPLRSRGYQSTRERGSTVDELRRRNAEGDVIILLIWFDIPHSYEHYVVMTGYNETGLFVNDPWPMDWGQPKSRGTGRNAFISYGLLADLWEAYDRWAMFVPAATTLTVVVQDLFGFGVEGARVVVSLSSGDAMERTTDSRGEAEFAPVPRDRFSIEVESWGVKTTSGGDAALSRRVTVTIPLSNTTVFTALVLVALFALMAHRTRGVAPEEGPALGRHALLVLAQRQISLLRGRRELGCGSCQGRPRFVEKFNTKPPLWGLRDESDGTHPDEKQARGLQVEGTTVRSAG
jgi:hypothetical protein